MKHGLNLFSRSCISCLLLASLSTVNLSAQSDAKVIDRIMEIGENDNRTMEHLDVLSNKIGGRLIGFWDVLLGDMRVKETSLK